MQLHLHLPVLLLITGFPPGLGIPERTRVLKSKGATLIFIRGDFAVNGTSTSYAGKKRPSGIRHLPPLTLKLGYVRVYRDLEHQISPFSDLI
jgi:hypothetical protein